MHAMIMLYLAKVPVCGSMCVRFGWDFPPLKSCPESRLGQLSWRWGVVIEKGGPGNADEVDEG